MACNFRTEESDTIFNTDSDIFVLGGPVCISICSFVDEKVSKQRKK